VSGDRVVEIGKPGGMRGWVSLPLITDGDDLTVGKFITLLEGGRLSGSLNFLFKVEGDVTQLLLDVTDDFSFGGGGEGVAAFGEDFHKVIGKITTSKVETKDGMGQGVSYTKRI
jgi:hypothetical protein